MFAFRTACWIFLLTVIPASALAGSEPSPPPLVEVEEADAASPVTADVPVSPTPEPDPAPSLGPEVLTASSPTGLEVAARIALGLPLSLIGGAAGAFAGAAVGTLVGIAGALVSYAANPYGAGTVFLYSVGIGAGLGYVAGTAMAASFTAEILDTPSSGLGAFTGSLIGAVAGGLLLFLPSGGGVGSSDGGFRIVGLLFPILGAVAGQEIALALGQSGEPKSASWRPTFAPSPDGRGFAFGLNGKF